MTMHKKKILNSNPLLFLSMLCIVIIIFLTTSVNVHAQGNTYTIPYNVVDYQSNNSACMAYLNDIFNTISSNVPSFNLNDCLLVPYRVRSNVIYIYCLSDPYIQNDYSSISSIWQDSVNIYGSTNSCIVGLGLAGDGSLNSCSVTSSGSVTAVCFGQNNIDDYYSSSYTYQINYPFFANSYIYDTSDNLIIDVNFEWSPDDATLEEFQDALDISSTISTGIDNSLSDLQNQKGFFDTLISNLKNMFNSLNGWINNGFTFLSNAFKTFLSPFLSNIQNFLSQIKGSVEDFKEKFSHFFEMVNSLYNMGLDNNEFSLTKLITALLVPEVDDMVSTLNQHSIGVFIVGTLTICGDGITYVTNWLNTPAVKVFHIPTFTFGGTTYSGLVFDFGWYDNYKSYGDAIISFFLVINYVFFLYRFLPRFFRSAGSGFSDFEDLPIQQGVDHRIPF